MPLNLSNSAPAQWVNEVAGVLAQARKARGADVDTSELARALDALIADLQRAHGAAERLGLTVEQGVVDKQLAALTKRRADIQSALSPAPVTPGRP